MRYEDSIENFIPWQPSTWPEYTDQDLFIEHIRRIFTETILSEINNVISDAQIAHGDLTHRGHVIAIALFCAVDTISSYAYEGNNVGRRYRKFIQQFFPDSYKAHSKILYKSYRNSLVHSWNLFDVGILPGAESVTLNNGTLYLGLIDFSRALNEATNTFLENLRMETSLQRAVLKRYKQLRSLARA